MMQTSGHIQETRSRQRCARSSCLFMLVGLLFISYFLFSSPSHAELKSLSQDQLKTATAQAGLVDFSINNTTARIFLDVHIETQATIEQFSAGWYSKNLNPDDPLSVATLDWDQQWNGVTIGNATESLTIDGLIFKAEFDNLSSPNPNLQRIMIGSNRLQGNVSGQFSRFSGIYNDILTGGSGAAVTSSRANLGDVSLNFNSNAGTNRGFFFILDTSPSSFGIQVVAGYSDNDIPTMASGPWWNSP